MHISLLKELNTAAVNADANNTNKKVILCLIY